MKFPCTLKNTLPIIRDCSVLSFATKGLGDLAAPYLPLLARYKLSCYQTTCYLQFQCLQKLPCWKALVISFCSSLGSTLLLIEGLRLIPYTCGSSTLRKKHHIVRPSPGRRPYNEVYYELSSGEEDNGKEDKVEEVAGAQAPKGGQAVPTEETTEKGDILQPLYDHLSPSVIEALRVFEIVSAQNTSLTREVILLEEQNIALRSINRSPFNK